MLNNVTLVTSMLWVVWVYRNYKKDYILAHFMDELGRCGQGKMALSIQGLHVRRALKDTRMNSC